MVDSRYKKTLVAIGGAALLTAAALPAAAQEEGPLLYVINKSADQQYFIDLQDSFVATAEELGASALRADAKLDPSMNISHLSVDFRTYQNMMFLIFRSMFRN